MPAHPTMTCPTCQITEANVNGRARYCSRDRTVLVALRRCHCGADLWPADKFCRECGTPVAASFEVIEAADQPVIFYPPGPPKDAA